MSLFVRERSQAGRDIAQYLYENSAQTTEHYMTKLLLVLGADKQFDTFEHGLHHDAVGIGDLHHAIEFECQVLFVLNVEHHTAYIRFMNRPNHLGHHRKTRTTSKSKDLFFLSRNKLIDHRNAGRTQQRLYEMGFNVSIFGDGIDDATNARHIDTEQFDLGSSRSRYVDNARQGSAQGHFIGKIHVSFL